MFKTFLSSWQDIAFVVLAIGALGSIGWNFDSMTGFLSGALISAWVVGKVVWKKAECNKKTV